jgi:hypothetical protein
MLVTNHPGADTGSFLGSKTVSYAKCTCAEEDWDYRCDEYIGIAPDGTRHYVTWTPKDNEITSGGQGYHSNEYGSHKPFPH